MKTIKVVYNQESKWVLDTLSQVHDVIIESYDKDHHKDKKKSILLMARYGAKLLPLLIFSDDEDKEYDAYWTESKKELTVELIKSYL